MIRAFGLPASITALHLFSQDASLKAHSAYRQALAGDRDAVLEQVVKLAATWLAQHRARFKPGVDFVARHAQEASGDNAIPQTLASVCAEYYGGCVDTEIVQSDCVYHAGAGPMERMPARAQFVGQVTSGDEYVLLDDVTNQGGALAELSNYIQGYGGEVRDVVVLVNGGRNPALVPEKKFVRLIKERFGDEITETFGGEPTALPTNEVQYLVGFQPVVQVRNRLAAAEQEVDRRLSSKGIARAPRKVSFGAAADQGVSSHGQLAVDR